MEDDNGRGASLAEVEALIRDAEDERERLAGEGHPRADPSLPSCPLGGVEVWLGALRARRVRLLCLDGVGPSGFPYGR